MNKAYLLIGGNLGDRKQNMATAREMIGKYAGTIEKASSIYETAAWGKTDQPAFYNQALLVSTNKTAQELLTALLNAEKEMGRVREEKMGPRLIDMDILFFNDVVIDQPHLHIPHQQLHRRRFALLPMQELAPALQHPVFQKNITQLLIECEDDLAVNKL